MSQENAGGVQTVTEDDLMKSLATLEGKAKEVVEEATPTVVTETLKKSTSDTIQELGSETLQKSLEVSEVLDEVVTVVGLHVDRSLDALQKSIQSNADRDMAMIRVLEGLKKSIDDNTAAVSKLMEQPSAPASSRPVTTQSGEILQKSVSAPAKETPNPQALRKSISTGLELLVKSNKDNPSNLHRFTQATLKFESAGQISDADMTEALKAAGVK